MTDSSNRHPADELAHLREKIAELRQREEQLRAGFLDGALPLEGDDHIVVVERKINERLDLRRMREQQVVPESVLAPYVVTSETVYVTLRQRDKGRIAWTAAASKVATAVAK
jgi:hypothetical protein